MNCCSFFIKNKALFGSYPTQESVEELEGNGVRHFINLTYDDENLITKYTTKYNYISYPIVDQHVPTNWQSCAKFILNICDIIKHLDGDDKIYIHCKGGHGRSGVIVACILCHMFQRPSWKPYN